MSAADSHLENRLPANGDSLDCKVRQVSDTPETDAAHYAVIYGGDRFSFPAHARKMERQRNEARKERNAAIRMAWELVQELAQKCSDPIHQRQLEQIRELHAEYILPNVALTDPAAKPKETL